MLFPKIPPPKPSVIFFALALLIAAAGLYWLLTESAAHSSFERYYAYLGCNEVLSRSDGYGVCRTNSGEVLRLVYTQGEWNLEDEDWCGLICLR